MHTLLCSDRYKTLWCILTHQGGQTCICGTDWDRLLPLMWRTDTNAPTSLSSCLKNTSDRHESLPPLKDGNVSQLDLTWLDLTRHPIPYTVHCFRLEQSIITGCYTMKDRQRHHCLPVGVFLQWTGWWCFIMQVGLQLPAACDYKLLIHNSTVCLYSCISEREPRCLIGFSHWSCCWFQRTCLPQDQLSRKRDTIVIFYRNMFSNVRVFVCEC